MSVGYRKESTWRGATFETRKPLVEGVELQKKDMSLLTFWPSCHRRSRGIEAGDNVYLHSSDVLILTRKVCRCAVLSDCSGEISRIVSPRDLLTKDGNCRMRLSKCPSDFRYPQPHSTDHQLSQGKLCDSCALLRLTITSSNSCWRLQQ
jgi:hypothetical protein